MGVGGQGRGLESKPPAKMHEIGAAGDGESEWRSPHEIAQLRLRKVTGSVTWTVRRTGTGRSAITDTSL